MTPHRPALPQMSRPFLTDGGLETTLVFIDGLDLPCFAAFPLLLSEDGRARLTGYFAPYLAEAEARGVGFVLDTPTWRANPDWAARLGYGLDELRSINRRAVDFAAAMRAGLGQPSIPVLVSGVVGPRGDGYVVESAMTPGEAAAYHGLQMEAFRDGGADMASAITMTYAEEAIGIARAAEAFGLPIAVSFTVETDGRLPSGETLGDAILRTDAGTGSYPAYYMVNCAHPDHFAGALSGPWAERIRGIRANASRKSHAELDACTELDIGDPAELGTLYRGLRARWPKLNVLGGCCGTDRRHIRAICEACLVA